MLLDEGIAGAPSRSPKWYFASNSGIKDGFKEILHEILGCFCNVLMTGFLNAGSIRDRLRYFENT
jgi:hypothetical protein